MTRYIKFVAAALAIYLLAVPLWAAGSCLAKSLTPRHCVPDCPMMKSQAQSAAQITESAMPGEHSCCQVSGALPVSQKSALNNQNQDWAQVNRIAIEVVALYPPAAGQPLFLETAPPPSSSSHQAFLCVFLV